VAFRILYVNDFIAKLCRQQTEGIQYHENENVHNIGQGDMRLKLGCGQAYDHSIDYTAVIA
jgi:hypothetical protein